jgi:hypothetical protein
MKRVFQLTRTAGADDAVAGKPTVEEIWDALCRGDSDLFTARRNLVLPVQAWSLEGGGKILCHFFPDSPMWDSFVQTAPPPDTVCTPENLMIQFWQVLPSVPLSKRPSAEALLLRQADFFFARGGVDPRILWPAVRIAEKMYVRGVDLPPILMEKVVMPKLERHAEEIRKRGSIQSYLKETPVIRNGQIPDFIVRAVIERMRGGGGFIDDDDRGITAAGIALKLLHDEHPEVVQAADRMMRTNPERLADDHMWMLPWVEKLWRGRSNFPQSWINAIEKAADEDRLPHEEDNLTKRREEPEDLRDAKALLWEVYDYALNGEED